MSRQSFLGTAAVGSMLAGTSVVAFNMYDWANDDYYFSQNGGSPASIISFYVAQAISVMLLLLGFYFAYQFLKGRSRESPQASLLGIIGTAVTDARLMRAATAATALYGLLYAFASSILVYQPGVNFAAAYGTTGALSWSSVPCCGSFGTVPELIFYASPAHFAVQLVPLSVLLLFIVPPLVGLNLSIAMLSVRRTVARATGRWMVACGAAVGLFTACPTCAGFFLAESIGGLGATTLAVALAPYQALFIGVSIPLLIFMPFFFAARVRRAASPLSQTPLRGVEPPEDRPIPPGNR